jgi:hypothetical protein
MTTSTYDPADIGKQSLPIDRNREFDPDDYPTTPTAYCPIERHFGQRLKDPERMLDRELDGVHVIRRTITRGQLRDNKDGCGCFVLNWHGVQYYLVVGFHEQGWRVIISGWPMLQDRTTALNSGRWTGEELDTIEAFNNRHFGSYWTDEWDTYVEWSKNHPDGGDLY